MVDRFMDVMLLYIIFLREKLFHESHYEIF